MIPTIPIEICAISLSHLQKRMRNEAGPQAGQINDDYEDAAESPVKWRVEGAAKTLNSGVFFQPIVERKTSWNMRTGTEGAGSSWYYYEFAPDGSSDDIGYVIVAGWRPVSGGDVTIPNDAMQDGFLIRKKRLSHLSERRRSSGGPHRENPV